MWIGSEQSSLCGSANEQSVPLVNNAPLTGYGPNFFDDYHFSETTVIFVQESSSDTRPSYLHDSEISDDTIGRALSSPLFTQEREEPAGRAQAYHSPEEILLSSQSLSVGNVRTGRPVNEFGSPSSSVRENPCRDSENEQIRILLERQNEQILMGLSSLNEVGLMNRALEGDEQLRRDQQLLHDQLLEQNRELREAHVKSLNEMEELKRF